MRWPLATSQSVTVPVRWPDASVAPAGSKAIVGTVSPFTVTCGPSGVRESTLHVASVLSWPIRLTDASRVPSGLKATACTAPLPLMGESSH